MEQTENGAEKERNHQGDISEQVLRERKKLSSVSLMFFTISFLGWCMEVVFCSSGFTRFYNRGFLTLPFCVIYGTPLCLTFLMLGTPQRGILANAVERTSLKKGQKIFLRYALYFLLTAAFATLFELVFGFAFDALGVRLWSYRRFSFNYKGYVCLWFSLIWGFIITLFMSTLWHPLYKAVSRLPKKAAVFLNVLLWIAVIGDFSFNFAYLLIEKRHFELIFQMIFRNF